MTGADLRIGVKFPAREIGRDRGLYRAWIERAEALGFRHVVVNEHVLGVDPSVRPEWAERFPEIANDRSPYTHESEFHEPLTLLAFFAALCELELVAGVLVLPQRQTALVAKQAAEVDVVSGGRLRLCVAQGWNPIEYEALGVDFGTRAKRFDEQLALLRELWTRPVVEFDGRFDRVVGAGIAPLPVQRPIPLWIGGFSDAVLRRVGRVGDGWYMGHPIHDDIPRCLALIAESASEAGRDPAAIGIEGSLEVKRGLDSLAREADAWAAAGATHLVVEPMMAGFSGQEHLALLDDVAARLPLGGR